MSYTVEPMTAIGQPASNSITQDQFDLPVKEFLAYDPKASLSVTGKPIEKEAVTQNETHQDKIEEKVESASEESVKLSPKISALARKEAEQRRKEQAFKVREKELEARLAKAERFEKLQSQLASKDYSAAEEMGMSYEEYTQYLLNKTASESPESKRARELEEKLKVIEKSLEQKEINDYNANQSLWKKEVARTVAEDDRFKIIRKMGAEDAVLQHINDSFDEDDVELTAEEAALDIAAHLKQRAEAARALLEDDEQVLEKKLGPPKSSPKTITNNMAPTSVKAASKPFHLMSESEQIAEAYRRVQAAKQGR